MRKLFNLFIVFGVLAACNKTEVKEYHYSSGALLGTETLKNGVKDGITTEYYETGEIRTIAYFKKGVVFDTLKGFYKSGNLELIQFSSQGTDSIYTYYDSPNKNVKSKGTLVNEKAIGWHKIYKENGKIASYLEFIDIGEPKPYINRGFLYDDQGKIIDSLSGTYKINVPNTLLVNKKHTVTIKYLAPVPKDSEVYFCYSYEIDDNFANLKEVKLDTIILNNHETVIDVLFKTAGEKKLRGFFEVKQFKVKPDETNATLADIIISTSKMYFDTSLYVKSSDIATTSSTRPSRLSKPAAP